MSMLKEWGYTLSRIMYSDASAALGIIERRGIGKLRHIDTSFLWLQEVNAKRSIKYNKVPGSENPADIGTKCLGQDLMNKHLETLNMKFEDGRATSAPEIGMLVPCASSVCARLDSCRRTPRSRTRGL